MQGEVGKKKRAASWRRKPQVIEQMNELIDELEEIDANIALQAVDHIHANEVIRCGVINPCCDLPAGHATMIA